jgi:hypothetical protein
LAAGGGLVPDVVLHPDTLDGPETVFANALDGHVALFRDVLTAYALDLRKAGTVASERFTVTPTMCEEVRRRLAEHGVVLADSVYTGGERVVSEQLGYEVARYVFGPAAERRRRVVGDDEVQQAVALLRGTTTPQALLGLGPSDADRPH